MTTLYRFIKNGKIYYSDGENRFSAQLAIEVAGHIDLTGATFEVIFKNKVIRTGTVN